MNKQPIYGALGVGEIWRCGGQKVVILRRRKDGKYHSVSRSSVFPQLPIERVNYFLEMVVKTSQQQAVRAFRKWLQETAK